MYQSIRRFPTFGVRGREEHPQSLLVELNLIVNILLKMLM